MAKILYVVSRPLQINTSASIRNRATISGLVENGHQVDLITTLPDENHMAYDESMDLQGVSCHYIKLAGIHSAAKIGRRIKFLRPLYKLAVSIFVKSHIYDNLVDIINHTDEIDFSSVNYDYIISSSDPKSSHLYVEKLLKEKQSSFRGKWIQIWGDPFYDDITLPADIDKKKVYDEENRLLSIADKIVYVSKLTLKRQQERYSSNASKMEYHPIPYMKEKISLIEPLENRTVSLAYCGDFSSSVRNIMPFYNAVTEMEGIKGIICGNSDVKLVDNNNVLVYPRQPYDKVEIIENESDILVHLSNLNGGQIPGKIYQYSGTNKPILFILDGDSITLKNEFEKFNRFVFTPNDKESIANAINDIIKSNKKYQPVLEFSKKVVADNIIKF